MHKILHPLKALAVLAIILVMLAIAGQSIWWIGDSLSAMSLGDVPGLHLNAPDWARVLAGVIWVTLFSVALMGCLMNVLHFVRVRTAKKANMNPLKTITPDEVEGLNLWVDSYFYSSDGLKELWGGHQ